MAREVPGCTSWTSHGQRCTVPCLALGSTHGLGRQPSPSHMQVLLPELHVQCEGYRCPQLREAPNSFSSLNSLCMSLGMELWGWLFPQLLLLPTLPSSQSLLWSTLQVEHPMVWTDSCFMFL